MENTDPFTHIMEDHSYCCSSVQDLLSHPHPPTAAMMPGPTKLSSPQIANIEMPPPPPSSTMAPPMVDDVPVATVPSMNHIFYPPPPPPPEPPMPLVPQHPQHLHQRPEHVVHPTPTGSTIATVTTESPTSSSSQQQEPFEERLPGGRKQQETSSVSLPSHNMRWTDEEDELLRIGLLKFGYGKWKAISELVKTRNSLQCKNHARHWLLTDKMDENVQNQPTITKPGTVEDETPAKDEQQGEQKQAVARSVKSPSDTAMMMTESSQPPSPQPASFFNPHPTPADQQHFATVTDNDVASVVPADTATTAPTATTEDDCKHFDRDVITDDEKKHNPEWFCDSKSIAKSPERYMKIRNHILDTWHNVYKPEYMTKTAARRGLKDCGDVNAVGRVHAYLEQAKAINVGCPPAKPRAPATRRAPSTSSSRRSYFYYQESDDDENVETTQKRKSRPDDDYDGHSSKGGNRKNRPRPKRVTKKPQHYYDEDTRDPDDPFCLVPVEDYVDFVMDFHSHLSYTEIIGLLGGRYVHDERKLYVDCVFPCRGTSSTDIECEMDPESEMKAREMFAQKGLSVVGWYHSHPTFEPNPSVRDIEYQRLYQTLFRDETTGIEPFIGIIVNPSFTFDGGDISRIQYVHIDQNQKNQPIPFACSYTILSSDILPGEIVEQMTNLVLQFKTGSKTDSDFDARMDKVIASSRANLPLVTEHMLNLIHNLRALMHENNTAAADGPSSSGTVSVM
ncbi:hypothetical protein BDB00DRAFT_326343 [Zychaea mexicana]|uniref:uncharacterized protein n=1 Tax=Zychaea mexicana TaxID=64656 RepID=UPI0022FE9706|nr:uncharacterized protein BDB00DRAFT_326343 [Zychaea mexicana]KAI9498930.1 hypothetical protein BDB00DRAFT_326343 [Zychaea mexicana]